MIVGFIGFANLKGMNFYAKSTENTLLTTSISTASGMWSPTISICINSDAYQMVISEDSPQSEEFRNQSFIETYKSAIDLYGLVHSRFILSPHGSIVSRAGVDEKKVLVRHIRNVPKDIMQRPKRNANWTYWLAFYCEGESVLSQMWRYLHSQKESGGIRWRILWHIIPYGSVADIPWLGASEWAFPLGAEGVRV